MDSPSHNLNSDSRRLPHNSFDDPLSSERKAETLRAICLGEGRESSARSVRWRGEHSLRKRLKGLANLKAPTQISWIDWQTPWSKCAFGISEHFQSDEWRGGARNVRGRVARVQNDRVEAIASISSEFFQNLILNYRRSFGVHRRGYKKVIGLTFNARKIKDMTSMLGLYRI